MGSTASTRMVGPISVTNNHPQVSFHLSGPEIRALLGQSEGPLHLREVAIEMDAAGRLTLRSLEGPVVLTRLFWRLWSFFAGPLVLGLWLTLVAAVVAGLTAYTRLG